MMIVTRKKLLACDKQFHSKEKWFETLHLLLHTKLLDYNRKGRGRYDPIFKGVNCCIFGLIFAPLDCYGFKPTNIDMFLASFQAKLKGYIYCPHSTIWLTSYKIVRITGWKRAIRKQIHACTYMYTQWPVLYYCPKNKKSFCPLKTMKFETISSNSIIHTVWIPK